SLGGSVGFKVAQHGAEKFLSLRIIQPGIKTDGAAFRAGRTEAGKLESQESILNAGGEASADTLQGCIEAVIGDEQRHRRLELAALPRGYVTERKLLEAGLLDRQQIIVVFHLFRRTAIPLGAGDVPQAMEHAKFTHDRIEETVGRSRYAGRGIMEPSLCCT